MNMRIDIDEIEFNASVKDGAEATKALFALLCEHHPEYGFEAPKVEVMPPPSVVAQEEKPKPQFWFWMEADPRDTQLSDMDRIMKTVCQYFGVRKNEIVSVRRDKKVVIPRHIAIYLCKTLTDHSLPKIGRKFGGRDHSTAINAIRKIERLLPQDAGLAFDVAHIETALVESHEASH